MANGNDEVVKLLKQAHDIAKNGDVISVALAMVDSGQQILVDYIGAAAVIQKQSLGLKSLHEKIDAVMDNCLTDTDDNLDYDHVCYNLSTDPLCFDFVAWLITMEMMRVHLKAPAPLRVGFFFGKDPTKHIDITRRDNWLKNVYRPALQLVGAVEDDAAIKGRQIKSFMEANITNWYRDEKVPVPRLHSPLTYTEGRHPVTITLRECDYWTYRNSNIAEWLIAAEELKRRGEDVLIIRDTAKADEPLAGFETDPRASKDLLWRMAVYEAAKCNLFISNGPYILAQFIPNPSLMCIRMDDPNNPDVHLVNTPDFWKYNMGISSGEQFPWFNDKQKLVWEPQINAEVILKAYDALELK